jgi:hypothetical protein
MGMGLMMDMDTGMVMGMLRTPMEEGEYKMLMLIITLLATRVVVLTHRLKMGTDTEGGT